MLPFLTGGCALDPCQRINDRMQSLSFDLMRDPDAVNNDALGTEMQRLAMDSVRYGCLAR